MSDDELNYLSSHPYMPNSTPRTRRDYICCRHS